MELEEALIEARERKFNWIAVDSESAGIDRIIFAYQNKPILHHNYWHNVKGHMAAIEIYTGDISWDKTLRKVEMDLEEYDISCLMEECGEVIYTCGKYLRFGSDDHYPDRIETNKENLIDELNDIVAITEILEEDGIIPPDWLSLEKINKKKEKVRKYMEYSKKRGTLDL